MKNFNPFNQHRPGKWQKKKWAQIHFPCIAIELKLSLHFHTYEQKSLLASLYARFIHVAGQARALGCLFSHSTSGGSVDPNLKAQININWYGLG